MTSPNDIISEFQKLKMETNKINENFLDTTSTFGCSSESILLRKVLDELKSMNSKVVEIKEKQLELQNVVTGIQEKQEAHQETLKSVDEKVIELKTGHKTLQDVLQKTMLDELKAIKSDMVIIKNKINKDAPGKKSVVEEPIINQNNAPEMHPDDEKPILEAIVGKWKIVERENLEEFLKKYPQGEWFSDDMKMSADGENISIEFIQHQKTFDYKIGYSFYGRISIEKNYLKIWYRDSPADHHSKHIHYSIKNGQMHRRTIDSRWKVECNLIYDRIE